MAVFLLSDKDLTADHHKKCAEKCTQLSGPMLKCLNVKAVGDLPCQHLVHLKCLVGLDATLVNHISKYYCIECTTNFPSIAKEMEKIVDSARLALENQKASTSSDDISQLRAAYFSLQQQLISMQRNLREQLDESDALEAKLAESLAETKRLKIQLHILQTSSSSNGARKSLSETSLPFISATDSHLISQSDTSLHVTTELEERIKQRRSKRPFNSTSLPGNVTFNVSRTESSIHNSSFISSSICPDYTAQEEKAAQVPETTLALLRSSIAKPQPFAGDINKWTVFRTDFVRSSARGHYRLLEDMDRLRELIQGEARELFITELCDPFAEPLNVLQRLDDFYGVRGNAVRMSLDRITALSKVDKSTDRDQLKSLYIHAKQFAAQCRANEEFEELTSTAVLYIFESKMHSDLIKAWRLWLRDNSTTESVDSIIKFLEERIKELNMVPSKQKATSNVLFTNATGGESSSSASSFSEKKHSKREKHLMKIKCFKCTNENHPFWRCPLLIRASGSSRIQMVNELHVCTRCLSSTKHAAGNCPNKLHPCRVPDCSVTNTHPLLHGHPDDKIKRFVSLNFSHVGDFRFVQLTSHYATIPGDVICFDGRRIPIVVMLDNGSGISMTSKSLFYETFYQHKELCDLQICHASGHSCTENSAMLFDLLFMPQGKREIFNFKDIFAVDNLRLPAQCQDADAFKQLYPHLNSVPLPSYSLQSPRVLLGLPHAGYLMQTNHIYGRTFDQPIAAMTALGWTIYGRCVNSL